MNFGIKTKEKTAKKDKLWNELSFLTFSTVFQYVTGGQNYK